MTLRRIVGYAMLFLIAFWYLQASAAPSITKIPGAAVTAQWPNGDQAELRVSHRRLLMLSVPFTITENLCGSQKGLAFNLVVAWRMDRLAWVWTQNQDAKKIGQVVTTPKGNVVLRKFYLNNTSDFAHPPTDLPNDELQFASVTWLPGMEDGVLRPFAITSWMSEARVPNYETTEGENKIAGEMNGVHLLPVNGDTFAIQKIDHGLIANIDYVNLVIGSLVGDEVSWVLNKSGKLCQISFKPNVGPARQKAKDVLRERPDIFVSYKWQQDQWSSQLDEEFFTDLNLVAP